MEGILAGALSLALACEAPEPRPSPAATPAARRDLLATERPLYSHANEEIVIRDFFQDRRDGFFLDVGCGHPIQDSNTYYLETRLSWTGIGVDALPELARKWKRNRPASRFFNFIVTDHEAPGESFYRAEPRVKDISSIWRPTKGPGFDRVESEEIRVPATTLTRLLERSGVSRIDLLSMDIELAEPLALAGFDIDRFQPELACIEAKPLTRVRILQYFASHSYRRIDRYLAYDVMNYYFTRDTRAATR